MPRILLIIIFFLIAVRPTNADVADEIKEYNKKGMPQVGSAMDSSGLTPNPTPGENFIDKLLGCGDVKVHGYSVAEQTEKDEVELISFFKRLLSLFGIGQNPCDIGNENAQKFMNDKYPLGEGRKILSKIEQNKNLALGESFLVLGTQNSGYSDQAMEYALDCSYCVNMPLGTCNCTPATPTPTVTPIPEVTSSILPGSYPSTYPLPDDSRYYGDTAKCRPYDYIRTSIPLPQICKENPDRFDTDSSISNGSCKIPNKGYCSPECLKPFFANDIVMARKASMICYKESVGQINHINDGCLKGVSNEYSVGLFQINLKNEDKNPWTKQPRSYQCWDTVEPAGSISCTRGVNIDSCTQKFIVPEFNIAEAWNLWYDRYIYYTSVYNNDLCDVKGGGLKWIWWGWTSAQEKYCNIPF